MLLNHIQSEIEKILWKNQNSFWWNCSITSPILTICQIIERVWTKNLEATLLFVNFSKAFNSIHRWKMEQILLAYGLYCIFQISIDLIKENGFTLEKARSWWYPTETITDSDYADDLALLIDTPAQAESLLHSLKQAAVVAGDIGFYMNTNKTDHMCFKQKGAISTPSSKPLKSIDQFTYLSSNISSTESDVNIYLVKTWKAINSLWIIWRSDLSDRIKQDFFQALVVFILLYRHTTGTLTKCIEKKPDGKYTGMLHAVLNNSWKQHTTKQLL